MSAFRVSILWLGLAVVLCADEVHRHLALTICPAPSFCKCWNSPPVCQGNPELKCEADCGVQSIATKPTDGPSLYTSSPPVVKCTTYCKCWAASPTCHGTNEPCVCTSSGLTTSEPQRTDNLIEKSCSTFCKCWNSVPVCFGTDTPCSCTAQLMTPTLKPDSEPTLTTQPSLQTTQTDVSNPLTNLPSTNPKFSWPDHDSTACPKGSVFHDDFSHGLNDRRWQLMRKVWGKGNNGLNPELVSIVKDNVNGVVKNVVKLDGTGDNYSG
jgi:hypothetical protein